MQIWAHRGASRYFPENTLEAFKMAVVMGADGVELDVQLTMDNKLVVIHDETVDRVSDGMGLVKDQTLRELRAYNYNKTHPEYEYASLPELEEVLALLKPSGITINIELKTGIYFYDRIEGRIVDAVKNMGVEDKIWYSSFNHSSVLKVREYDSYAHLGFLYMDGLFEPWEYAKRYGVEALHPAFHNLQYADFFKKSEECRINIHAWTVDLPKDKEWCAEKGIDAIITNYL